MGYLPLTDVRLACAALAAQLAAWAALWALGAGASGPWASGFARAALWANAAAVAVGLAVFVAFYRHTVVVVGNRAPVWAWRPHWTYFQITKPLELVYRFATAPLRCLPDVCVVGEVRCGTTTLAAHLRAMPGVRGPFCAFHHPLDGKESFYFAGHYFGFVHPYFYRAVFPLRIERWWHTRVLGRPFLVFDGCAQYLTSPLAPQLLRAACGPDVALCVCLREPVSQNASWWRFENASMEWFDAMGLPRGAGAGAAGADRARFRYPPATFGDALELSRSDEVHRLYEEAEALPASLPKTGWVVPSRCITWPNGQLSALTRNGVYADNLARWHRWFDKSRFSYFELSEYDAGAEGVLRKLHAALPEAYRALAPLDFVLPAATELHENATPAAPGGARAAPVPTPQELDEAAEFYRPHNERLFRMLGVEWPHWRTPRVDGTRSPA